MITFLVILLVLIYFFMISVLNAIMSTRKSFAACALLSALTMLMVMGYGGMELGVFAEGQMTGVVIWAAIAVLVPIQLGLNKKIKEKFGAKILMAIE